MSRRRHASRRRLQSANPRIVRRHAYRTSAVAADSSGRTSRRNRRRFAPARSARCPLQIPRAVRPPVKSIVRLISHQKFRHICIPQQNRTRPAQSRHQRRIFHRNVAATQTAPTLARPPRHIYTTLHRNRHAVQRPKRIRMRTRPLPNRSLRNLRLRTRCIHVHIRKRIQLRIPPRIQFRNPLQMRVH